MYLLKEYQVLKTKEPSSLERDLKRTLAKVNYKIHTDAIKQNLIPQRIKKTAQEAFVYANEADLLNIALFGITAKQRRDSNADLKGNMRDHATGEQLLVLANLESHNAEMIKQGIDHKERLDKLNQIAIYQMQALLDHPSIQGISELPSGEG